MSADVGSEVDRYSGQFEHGLDSSFRLMIPSAWRPPDKDTVFSALLWPLLSPRCLLVLPPERWREMTRRLKSTYSLVDAKGARLERLISGANTPMKLDKVGRFCLGERLATKVGIGKSALLAGRLDKFEIWSPERFVEEQESGEPITEKDLESVFI